jgi:hypothetical protein
MQRISSLFFTLMLLAVFILITGNSEAAAQRERREPIGSRDSTISTTNSSSGRGSLNSGNTIDEELNQLRNMGDLDPASQRKLFIIEDIKRLDDSSSKMLDSIKKRDKDYLKDVAKLAEKIAKAANSLRQKLTQKGKPTKVEASVPAPEGETVELLQRQANSMDELVLDVVDAKPAAIKKEDVVRLEQVCKLLEEVESKALGIREVARNEK